MGIQTIKIPLQSATVKPYIKQGDTIPAYTVASANWGFELTEAGVEINLQLYSGKQQVANYSVGSGITITSATILTVDEVLANTFPVGCLKGDLQISWLEDAERNTFTFFNVEYTIIKEYTIV